MQANLRQLSLPRRAGSGKLGLPAAVLSPGLAPSCHPQGGRVLCFPPSDNHLDASTSKAPRDVRVNAQRSSGGGNWDSGAEQDPSKAGSADDSSLLFSPWQLRKLVALPGIDLLATGLSVIAHLPKVYVILFGVGQKDCEGIYSLRAVSEDGLPQETIMIFENEDDAVRYAGLLEATMHHTPSVCSIPPAELVDFCRDSGYRCRFEPAGSLLIPPDYNVRVTDWERSRSLRDGKWSVLASEPEMSPESRSARQADEPPKVHHQQATATLPKPPHQPSGQAMSHFNNDMTEQELSQMRLKLEALLPPEEESGPTSA